MDVRVPRASAMSSGLLERRDRVTLSLRLFWLLAADCSKDENQTGDTRLRIGGNATATAGTH